jgi:glycosyltransferase involved in cell wall biosynthesis
VVGNSGRTARFASYVYARDVGILYPAIPEHFLVPHPEREKEGYFLYVSRLYYLKNVYNTIIAFYEFTKKNPSLDVRLKIAGDGPERRGIEALLTRLNIEGRVDMLGFVPNEELHAYFARAKGILNTPAMEPFGLITLEAWARYAPLIVSADAGSAEAVADGEDGLIVDPANPLSICSAMESLARDAAYGDSLAAAGYEKVKRRFLIQHHVDALLSLLSS